jgi:hypothetical protein
MGKYLDLYKQCIETGEMPDAGLCVCVGRRALKKIGAPVDVCWYWGYSDTFMESMFADATIRARAFTPIRQNIVLLLAAINNEL